MWEPVICGRTVYPPWPLQEIFAMLGQRVRDPLSLLPSNPSRGLTVIEPPHPYFHSLTMKSRRDGKKLSIPSTSPTPSERRVAPSTNSERRHLPALSYSNEAQSSDEYPGLPPFSPRSSVPWFSQRITQPCSICPSDFLTKRCDTVTCSFVFNVDFVVTILILPSLSNMEVGTDERSWLKTVFIIMSLDWCNPIAPASRWGSCHVHFLSKFCYLFLHCYLQYQLG